MIVFADNCSGGDDDKGGGYIAVAAPIHIIQTDGMGVDETGVCRDHVDAVAHELMPYHVNFVADDIIGAREQVIHRDFFFHHVGCAVNAFVVVAGKMHHRFAQGFAGDCTGVDAHATDHCFALDNCHALIQLGGLHGCALSGRPGTDHNHVVVICDVGHYSPLILPCRMWIILSGAWGMSTKITER